MKQQAFRYALIVFLLAGIGMLCVAWWMERDTAGSERDEYHLPADYRGRFIVVYGHPKGDRIRHLNGVHRYDLPVGGLLFTQDALPPAGRAARFYAGDSLLPVEADSVTGLQVFRTESGKTDNRGYAWQSWYLGTPAELRTAGREISGEESSAMDRNEP